MLDTKSNHNDPEKRSYQTESSVGLQKIISIQPPTQQRSTVTRTQNARTFEVALYQEISLSRLVLEQQKRFYLSLKNLVNFTTESTRVQERMKIENRQTKSRRHEASCWTVTSFLEIDLFVAKKYLLF